MVMTTTARHERRTAENGDTRARARARECAVWRMCAQCAMEDDDVG